MVICFTNYLLEKKGHLSRIWLAAYWENKLKRSYIFEIDIEKSIRHMISAEIILDLRISGHLLIGVVKIHSKKAQFLLNECNKILCLVSTFNPGKIDLPLTKNEACVKDITLPENFEDLDIFDDTFIVTKLSMNQGCIEDITLKENCETLTNLNEELHELEFDDEAELNFFEDLQLLSTHNDLEIHVDDSECITPKTGNEVETMLQNEENSNATNHLLADNLMEHDNTLYCKDGLKKSGDIKDHLSLEPVKGACKKKSKHYRKLIIDEVTVLSSEKIQKQMLDSSDLIAADFAPGTKRLMHLKQIGSTAQLFQLPNINMNRKILHLYQQNLKTLKNSEDMDSLVMEDSMEDKTLRKCKRKLKTLKTSILCESIQLDDDMESISDMELDVNGNGNASPEVQCSKSGFSNDEKAKHLQTYQELFDSPDEESTSNFAALPEEDDIILPDELCDLPDSWKKTFGGRLSEVYQVLQQHFCGKERIEFSFLIKDKTKLKVSQMFFGLLMLKKLQIVDLLQSKPYGEILIKKGKIFRSI